MDTLDWMTLAIIIGNMLIGKRKILNRDRDTKAFSASRTLFSSIKTKVMKVTKDTTNGAHDHTNEVPGDRKIFISQCFALVLSFFHCHRVMRRM
jgi:hypothetical protein